jgi:hypothetical protein
MSDETPTWNDLIRAGRKRDQAADREQLFGPEPEPEEPPAKPQGSANGGEGEVPDENAEYVWGEGGPKRMTVFDDPMNPTKGTA